MPFDYDKNTLADIPVLGARRFGERTALAMIGGEALNYRAVEELTRRAAARLSLLGIGRGERVAILSENSPEWGIASLGIARAGAVSVPLLNDFTPEQIGNIITHSEARAIFVSSRLEWKLAGLDQRVRRIPIEKLTMPVLDRELEWKSLSFRSPLMHSGDLAALVYTSGTTGLSKGVMLTHRNLLADALACSSVITLRPYDRVLSMLPLAHAYEYTIGFLIPMMSGSSIHYLGKAPSASVLMPALREIRPTIVLSVPLIIEKIYRGVIKPNLERSRLWKLRGFRPVLSRIAGMRLRQSFGGRLRFFGVGGAPLDPDTEDFLIAARFPHAIGYGLTETAPIIAAAAVGKTKTHSVGFPLPGAEIRIAAFEAEHEAHDEGVGEIQVRGPMLSCGYFKDPGRTAEAVTPEGFFRTGDLGRFDQEGRLYVRGRLKSLILGAAGENIYPEEVEAVINASPLVEESLVYGDESGLTALVHLRPEVLASLGEEAAALIGDRIEELRDTINEFVESAGRGVEAAGKSADRTLFEAARAIAEILHRIKSESNARLQAFSRITKMRIQCKPFEKTPTQKIKRFMYPRG